MLSDAEIRQIEAECSAYAQRRAVGPEALKMVQDLRGWVSEETLRDVATQLAVTPAELDAVATFYSLIFRQPVGEHVILICDSISCWILGYDDLREHLLKRLEIQQLGQTTADGKFTLLPVACLGACDHAPAMMIDDELYGDLTPQKIDDILSRFA